VPHGDETAAEGGGEPKVRILKPHPSYNNWLAGLPKRWSPSPPKRKNQRARRPPMRVPLFASAHAFGLRNDSSPDGRACERGRSAESWVWQPQTRTAQARDAGRNAARGAVRGRRRGTSTCAAGRTGDGRDWRCGRTNEPAWQPGRGALHVPHSAHSGTLRHTQAHSAHSRRAKSASAAASPGSESFTKLVVAGHASCGSARLELPRPPSRSAPCTARRHMRADPSCKPRLLSRCCKRR
jgi:hypothetical protein